jgi:hypothetical protein
MNARAAQNGSAVTAGNPSAGPLQSGRTQLHGVTCGGEREVFSLGLPLQRTRRQADTTGHMDSSFNIIITIVAGILLTLYIMRRRVRKGTRVAKF